MGGRNLARHQWLKRHKLIKGLKDAANKAGVETKLGTPATELILNKEGAVVGAKAVILATGGFGDDPQKVKNWASNC